MSGSLAKNAQRGFTLLEVMIAGGLLMTGIVGLMGMQITAINGNRFGNRMAQALMFAHEASARAQGQTWDIIIAYPQAADLSQNDGFKLIDPDNADPSGGSPAITVDGLTADGSVVLFNAGDALYQRIVQVRGEDLNPQISGIDAMRIKVTVRFRDSVKSTRWRDANIITLRPRML